MSRNNNLVVMLVLILATALVNGHGRLIDPPGRSSLWRFSEFRHLKPPQNYDDNQLFCGGLHQGDNPGRQCGVCGDPLGQKHPRDNEIGGKFYSGIIVAEYKIGEVINVSAQITAPHLGYMEWRLCTNATWESQDCFDRYLLSIVEDDDGGRGLVTSRVWVGDEPEIFRAKVKLPDNVSCDHCVIQWNYRAENDWGICPDGEGRLGCGPQETFRGCSDVRIISRTIESSMKFKHKKIYNNMPSRKHKKNLHVMKSPI